MVLRNEFSVNLFVSLRNQKCCIIMVLRNEFSVNLFVSLREITLYFCIIKGYKYFQKTFYFL